jgi:hypothetical protein
MSALERSRGQPERPHRSAGSAHFARHLTAIAGTRAAPRASSGSRGWACGPSLTATALNRRRCAKRPAPTDGRPLALCRRAHPGEGARARALGSAPMSGVWPAISAWWARCATIAQACAHRYRRRAPRPIEPFQVRLRAEAPPLARIDSVHGKARGGPTAYPRRLPDFGQFVPAERPPGIVPDRRDYVQTVWPIVATKPPDGLAIPSPTAPIAARA